LAVNVTLRPNIAAEDGDTLVNVVDVVPGVSNRATQFRATARVTLPSLQSASPLHPSKTNPEFAVAVKVTTCPKANGTLQVAPQLMPAGLLVTVPVPVPTLVTVKAGGVNVKVAVQLRSTDIVIEPSRQSASPLHAAKVDPRPGVAVKSMIVPGG
jgi:hypothetical protein